MARNRNASTVSDDSNKIDRATWLLGLAVTSAVFVLYFATAARDIVVGDTPEFVTTAATLGVPHPPGYPLLTLLGHLFTWLPFHSIPFRVNLLAVVCNTLAVAVIYFTAFRLTGNRLAAAVAALVLAINPLFWSWSLAAEVFPLNNLLASLLIYFLIAWHKRPDRKRFLVAASLVFGLGIANHQTLVLLAPAIAYLLWLHRDAWWLRPKLIAACALSILLGFAPYLYVPWAAARHPFLNWGSVSSLADLYALIARSSYGIGRLTNTAGFMAGSPLQRIFVLCTSLGFLMAVLVFLGLIWSYRQRRSYFLFVVIAFLSTGIFFAAIANLDLARERYGLYVLERFFLLPQIVLAPLAAMGLLWIAQQKWASEVWALRAVAGIIAIGLLIGIVIRYPGIDQSRNHVARTFAEDLFASIPPKAVLLINGDEIVLPLDYMQAVEKNREDVVLVTMPLLPADWYIRQLRERHPNLSVPFTHYDGQTNSIKKLVDANQNRPVVVVGTIPNNDASLAQGYWLYSKGLANIVVPIQTSIGIDQGAKENEELMKRYRPPDHRSIKGKGFETNILFAYAFPAQRLGAEYENVGSKQEARKWYERALAIDPDLPAAREGLARIGPSSTQER